MEYRKLTAEQIDLLNKPLPAEAVTPHPTKKYLSSIKSIYVTERLNEVFGVGIWRIKTEIVENCDKMIVIKTFFSAPEYGIEYECYGGNDNSDRGDAFKGATTDAITKIGSWLGIGADVFKGKHSTNSAPAPAPAPATPKPRKAITSAQLDKKETCDKLLAWAYAAKNAHPDKPFEAGEFMAQHYDVTEEVKSRFSAMFTSYLTAISQK